LTIKVDYNYKIDIKIFIKIFDFCIESLVSIITTIEYEANIEIFYNSLLYNTYLILS